jgi:hypothetical protein
MAFNEGVINAVVARCGGVPQPEGDVESLLAKLRVLEGAGRYGRLLGAIEQANDRSNFFSALLEATFAFQFERVGLDLSYEVRQDCSQRCSIDFLRRTGSGDAVYFEARLLQQDQGTANDIAKQLLAGPVFSVLKGGADEHDEIIRLQSAVLSKVQEKDGTPIKFVNIGARDINVVVMDVTEILLGMADVYDCMLAMYGDPEVPEHCRRGVFGLFQEPKPGYPPEILAVERSFQHLKRTLHGMMFLFRRPQGRVLAYELEQAFVWNRAMVDKPRAQALFAEIQRAVPPVAVP